MIDGCRPTLDIMTQGAVRAVLPVVLIVFLVAGVAIGRRALEYIVNMATLTGDANMLASQCEAG